MAEVSDVRSLIDLWPTRAVLAEDIHAQTELSVSAGQVHKWAKHGAVPAKYQMGLLKAARVRGFPVTADMIVALHAAPRAVA